MSMKIVYFNYMADLYGSSIGSTIKAQMLFSHLEKFGHKVIFNWLAQRTHQNNGGYEKKLKFSFFRILFYTPKQLLRNFLDFYRELKIVRQNKPDILIVRLDAFRVSALFLARLYHLPLIIEADGACSYEWLTFHKGPHIWPRVLLLCEKVVLYFADGVFVQSKDAQLYYQHRHNLTKRQIAVITNGAEPVDFFREEIRENVKASLGFKKGQLVIGFLGSLHLWHGVESMKKVVMEILNEFENVRFLFVGQGGAQAKEFQQSLEEKYKNRVVFTGTVSHEKAKDYIQIFDIALAPYPLVQLFYFSPMKLFEYMAAGKAVIAADIGQISQVINNRVNGLLYKPGNNLNFKDAIVECLQNAALRIQISQNAQKDFAKYYTWNQKANELNDFIHECIL